MYIKYDDTPPEAPDFQTTFDDTLDGIGVDTVQEKLFGAFLIMGVIAVLLGLKFKNVAIVILSQILLIFIFTVIGWFSMWFILVIAILFVLMLILKGLSKGGE